MVPHEVVAAGVVQYREAPGVAEGDEMRLAREEVDGQGLETCDAARAGRCVETAAQLRLKDAGPYEVEAAVPLAVEVGEEAVEDVW